MKELTILISWHNEKNAQRIKTYELNKSSFIEYNPDYQVITVMNPFGDLEKAWLGTDLTFFQWYKRHGIKQLSARYLLVEWDCWCDCNVKDYFSRVWDCDVVGPCVKYPERDDWYWFSTINQLPEHARMYSTGIVPFSGLLLSDKAMKTISQEILKPAYEHLNSELRLATIASMLGLHPVANPVYSRSVSWRKVNDIHQRQKGLHHPRKNIN